MSNKLNMAIAKTHTLTSRLLGMQLTGGTLLGVGFSAAQMSAGFLIIGGGVIKGNLFMGGLIFLIGIGLAILVERLSLGGLSAMRVAKDAKKKSLEDFFALLEREQRDPTEREKLRHDALIAGFDADKKAGRGFAAVGIILSAGVGDVFWHYLFESLSWVGVILSVACALVISLTFIHSELFKGTMDGVLRHILTDLHLMRVAVAAEGSNVELGMMSDAYTAVAGNREARRSAEEQMEKTIIKRMERFAKRAASVAEEVDALNMGGVNVVEGTLTPLALPAPGGRGKYHQHREELIRLLRSNPNLTQRDIADHFQISRSSAKDWFDNLKAGK